MNATPLLLGIDLGASALKAMLVDARGRLVAESQVAITTSSPHPGWSEQSPREWREALWRVLRTLLHASPGAAPGIQAVSVCAGAHIAVLEDAHGEAIRPAIMWSDQRSQPQARELCERHEARILALSLNRPNPTWTLCQLAWLARHEPEAVRRVKRLRLAKDYLRSCLTGDWCTDFSDALGALMADHERRDWSGELAGLIGWPVDTLPPVHDPLSRAGVVSAGAAACSGLRPGTPVVVGSNDTTVELLGVGSLEPGDGAIKLATAGVVFITTAGPEVHPPVSCYPHLVDGRWYMAAGINNCAGAHRWVRDLFYRGMGEEGFQLMDREAQDVPPGADGLLFHPYLLGERAPHWDPRLRGGFIGARMHHQRGHFARACYEGIAMALYDALRDMLERSGAGLSRVRLLGGGARSETWSRIIADVTGLRVLRPERKDAAFGAALVAGIGSGLFADAASAVRECVRIRESALEPDGDRHAFYLEHFATYDTARRALVETSAQLSDRYD